MKNNPFYQIYVGDRISSGEFVALFSPECITHTEALFYPGNIVLIGIQGSGKSMLLRLLRPQTRFEYHNSNVEFPVAKEARKFICGSVNLAHSNVIDFGYRNEIDTEVLKTELLFGDFLNYLLIQSFCRSIEEYTSAPDVLSDEAGIRVSKKNINEFAKDVANLPIWEGWFENCKSFDELKKLIDERIHLYRRFVHRKDLRLNPRIYDTATPVGIPLNDFAFMLRENKYIDEDTNVFVDIDQYEELGNISSRSTKGASVDYRSVINKALSARSPFISYRIGTRGYSWKRHGKIHGTNGNLEEERDYKYVDLDLLMRRDEIDSGRENVFDHFALDVFERRLKHSGYIRTQDAPMLEEVYGKRLTPEQKVNKFLGLREPSRFIKLEDTWRTETKNNLKKLARTNLFAARLAEAWIRQKGDLVDWSIPPKSQPWEIKRWWIKERRHICMMQLSARSSQRTIWAGSKEILELSGNSILAFLTINQTIWDTALKSNSIVQTGAYLPQFTPIVQSIGIIKASERWIGMIKEQSGLSSERMRFVKIAAAFLRARLLEDDNMSAPGQNGFSLLESDIDQIQSVKDFLESLSDYGNILMMNHVTKSKDKLPRMKFYFHPIYCPSLRLPYVREKEPYYAKLSEVAGWINDSGINVFENSSTNTQRQLNIEFE